MAGRLYAQEVQFTIIRRNARGGQHSSSGGVLLGELQGLTREQAFGARTDVSFRIVREGGTFHCEDALIPSTYSYKIQVY